jgi:hypothetical protein
LESAINEVTAAIARGNNATEAEATRVAQTLKIAQDELAALQQQRQDVLSAEPRNDAQRNTQQALLAEIQATERALQGQISAAESALRDIESAARDTAKASSEVLENVVASAGDVFDRFKAEQESSLAELLQAREGYIGQVDRLEQNGVISAKEAADARVEIEKAANDQIDEARQESLAQFERAINNTIAAIDQGAQSRINAVLQQQAAGTIDENEAARQIAEINDRIANDTIFAKQREIDKVRALEAEKVISAEEAADRIQGLQGEIGELTGQRLQAEIAEQQRLQQVSEQAAEAEKQRQEELQQAAIERINTELEGVQRVSQAQQISLDIASTALANETSLLHQGLQLSQARANLDAARL